MFEYDFGPRVDQRSVRRAGGRLRNGGDAVVGLLSPDATSPTRRSILGVPTFWSPYVEEGLVWLVSQPKAFVVIRSNTTVVTDSSAYFSSDRQAIRSTTRVSFAWPHQAAVIRIGTGGS
jgi:hypothetical protein